MTKEEVNTIVPKTELEAKCLEKNCPHFVVWSYYGQELHSCKLQGESDTISQCADSEECMLNQEKH